MAENHIREEEVKNRLRQEFFSDYDATPVLGDIDFSVTTPKDDKAQAELFDREFFLWAEAKAGTKEDIYASFIQLIITIGKARSHEKMLPPHFLGAFDEEKIAFVEFHHIVPVLYQNDFNWNVTPSAHNTKEFKQLYSLLHDQLQQEISLFYLQKDRKALQKFIHSNFRMGKERTVGVNITKNNYVFVFQRWVEEVKPTIAIEWADVPPTRVVDFFYADLISRNDYTLRDELAVVLRGDRYKVLSNIMIGSTQLFSEAQFNDGMVAYRQFWNKYNRPPRHEYLDIILMRRDLLIPQDLRKYQGAFFTPPQWVQKSQEYIADELGDDWQQEYYVWDCCAGTGNLLFGLNEPYRVYASTLDNADVKVMRERIKERSLNLVESHVFQFDFLNDPFTKLPQSLQDIINDPKKRKKLVIYINPPYAEAGNSGQRTGKEKNKSGVAFNNYVYNSYKKQMGLACRELFAQFFTRIYKEIPSCVLAEFSTLKILQAPNFCIFRNMFRAKLGRNFIVPAATFDNVNGQFPIGFFIWHTGIKELFAETYTDVYDIKGEHIDSKLLSSYLNDSNIIIWLRRYYDKTGELLGYLRMNGTNVQNNLGIYITSQLSDNDRHNHFYTEITANNLREMCIYMAMRQAVEATWLNDREQYLVPKDDWETDLEFQSDCLMLALFHGQNRISSAHGPNHWIPFTEAEVGAREVFGSHFMHQYISGKLQKPVQHSLFEEQTGGTPQAPMAFSVEAQAVLAAARQLWQYYHSQPGANPDASYYDIRLHFQGTKVSKSGKLQMNAESNDLRYTELIAALRTAVKQLARKIEPKVYEYGFLKR